MSFSINPDDNFSKVFLLVTLLMLVLVMSFSCTPDANFSEEYSVCMTIIMLVLMRSFSYCPHADYGEDVLKHFVYWIGENRLLH